MIALMVLYLISSCVYIFMGFSALFRDSKSKLNKIYFIICINLSLWAFINALMTVSLDAGTATFYRRLSTFSWATIYCEVLYFIIYMTKKEGFLKKLWHHIALFIPAAVSIYLYFFYPVMENDIVKISVGWAFLHPINRGLLWDQFLNVYYVSYMMASILLIYNWGLKSKLKREKRQSKIIAYSMISSIFFGSITDLILPQLGIPLMPPLGIIVILITIGGIWYSMTKYQLMSLTVETVVLDVLKIMNEGLIIINHLGDIISANRGALQLLGYAENEVIGQSIHLMFPNHIDINKDECCNSREIEMISKKNKQVTVLLSSSVLRDNFEDKLGTVYIFQNISEMKKIQGELKNAHNHLEKRVEERTQELNVANSQLEDQIEERIAKEEEIYKLAFNDQLTGLPNRRLFNDRLDQTILQAVRNKKSFEILFLDLDGFKMINDTMGHAQGDELLKMVAVRLTNTLRKSDVIARVGGDEFLILIHNVSTKESIEKVCENIIKAIKEPFEFPTNEIYITTSIGVSVFPQDGEDVETLVKNADIAMYVAKENGKGKFAFCNEVMKKNLDEAMMLSNDLYRALDSNELELYYQPQVATASGRIVGLEALLRWNHPKLGLIGPADFIPIAEKTGLIVVIGEWVLRTACTQTKAWHDYGFLDLSIAVNLSVNQIVSRKLVKQVYDILIETGLNPKKLELEITESIFMNDINDIVDTLEELKSLDIRIAIDDFGTDYSSLSYLKQLPLDRIKIAKTFIDGIDNNISDESIITAIIILGKKLGLDLIAEGVETDQQLQFLKTQMCDEIQGYYYYRPMPVEEIDKLMKSDQGY